MVNDNSDKKRKLFNGAIMKLMVACKQSASAPAEVDRMEDAINDLAGLCGVTDIKGCEPAARIVDAFLDDDNDGNV